MGFPTGQAPRERRPFGLLSRADTELGRAGDRRGHTFARWLRRSELRPLGVISNKKGHLGPQRTGWPKATEQCHPSDLSAQTGAWRPLSMRPTRPAELACRWEGAHNSGNSLTALSLKTRKHKHLHPRAPPGRQRFVGSAESMANGPSLEQQTASAGAPGLGDTATAGPRRTESGAPGRRPPSRPSGTVKPKDRQAKRRKWVRPGVEGQSRAGQVLRGGLGRH